MSNVRLGKMQLPATLVKYAPHHLRQMAIVYDGIVVFTSASARCLDRGNVDLLHRHHGIESAFCLTAPGRKRIG